MGAGLEDCSGCSFRVPKQVLARIYVLRHESKGMEKTETAKWHRPQYGGSSFYHLAPVDTTGSQTWRQVAASGLQWRSSALCLCAHSLPCRPTIEFRCRFCTALSGGTSAAAAVSGESLELAVVRVVDLT